MEVIARYVRSVLAVGALMLPAFVWAKPAPKAASTPPVIVREVDIMAVIARAEAVTANDRLQRIAAINARLSALRDMRRALLARIAERTGDVAALRAQLATVENEIKSLLAEVMRLQQQEQEAIETLRRREEELRKILANLDQAAKALREAQKSIIPNRSREDLRERAAQMLVRVSATLKSVNEARAFVQAEQPPQIRSDAGAP